MSGCTLESQRCEFWAQGGAYMRPPCCTQHLKDLLIFTHQLLERHGIAHWLDFGAVLGAVRTGEFVPWDGDVDFGVWFEDADRIRALEDEVIGGGHVLDMSEPYVWRIVLSPTNTQHADLFPWRDDHGTLRMRWPGFPDDAWSFPRQFVDQVRPVKLYGESFLAPAPVHEFLARYRYGDDYMVPRRFEDLELRSKVAPAMRRFLARRRFEERRQRNLQFLCQALDSTPLRGCYVKTMEAAFDPREGVNDEPDVAFQIAHAARRHFVDALPELQTAGFQLMRDSTVADTAKLACRLAKDGICFDFLEQPDAAP